MKKLHRQRIVSVLVIAELALNSFGSTLLISPVYAQEASSSANLAAIPTEATNSAKQNPDLLTQASSSALKGNESSRATPSTSFEQKSTPSATSLLPNAKTETVQGTSSPAKEITSQTTSTSKTPSLWTLQNGAYTTETLRLGVTYRFPPNEKVSLTFTKLPEVSGTVTVKEHEVPQTVENAGSRDYEITSNMPNGTFSFDLTLPTNDPTKKVLSSNDGQNYGPVSNETVVSSDVVAIKGITHLTHFVVGSADGDTFGHPVINEFSSASSPEWVEIYNPTDSSINLTGWKLKELTNPDTTPSEVDLLNLSGILPSRGFLAFNVSGLSLNNLGDSIGLYQELTLRDRVSYGTVASPYNANTRVSAPGATQSAGSQVNGGLQFVIFATPTKGTSNGATLDTLYVDDGWDSPDNDGGHTWGFDAFNTIQEAINFAPSGSTINVEPGTYYEELTIDKNLTLSGPGISSEGNLATINSECLQTVGIMASNVAISGFDLTEDGCNSETVVYIGSSLQNVTITENIIRDGYYGIYTNGSTNTIIQGNEIGYNTYGVYLTGDISGTSITTNNIHDNGEGISASGATFDEFSISNNQIVNNNDGYGIYFNGISGANLTISGNTVANNYSTGIYLSGGGGQISDSTITISGNTISSNGGDGIYADVIINSIFNVLNNTEINGNSGNGIYICAEGYCSGSTVAISGNSAVNNNSGTGIYLYDVRDASTVNISDNMISNNGDTGIFLDSSVNGVNITGNTISDNGTENVTAGIVVNNALGNEAHQNIISGNGEVGVQNNDLQDFFDATLNFWGDASGPLDGNLNPNGLGDRVAGRVLFSPFYTDSARSTLTEIKFNASNINLANFDDWGIFDLSEEGEELVRFVDLLQQFEFEVVENGGENDIVLPEGVRIERSDDLEFDWDSLSLQDVAESLMSGFDSTTAIVDAIQWGLPGIELEFSTPITVRIFVGTSFNGQTLNVVRSTSGSGGWTSNGIVAPATCVVTAGICTFQATLASYFAAARNITTSQTSSSSTNQPAVATSTNTSGTQSSTAACNDPKPAIPTLNTVSIDNATAKLSWTRPNAPVSYYQVLFGPVTNSAQYQIHYTGNPDQTTYLINGLNQGATYYFRVRAVNGCTHGDYSNELSATPQVAVLPARPSGGPATTLQNLAAILSPVVLGSTITQPSAPEEKIQPVGETSKEIAKNILGEKSEKEPPIKPPASVISPRDIFLALALAILSVIGVWFILRRKVV